MDSAVATEPTTTKRSVLSGAELLAVVEDRRAVGVPESIEHDLLELVAGEPLQEDRTAAECALGLLSRQRGDFDSAREHFDRAAAARPGSEVAARSMIYLAGVHALQADFDGAQHLLNAAVPDLVDADLPLLELQYGFLAELREQYDEAILRYGRAIDLGGVQSDRYVLSLALNNRANVWQRLGNLDEAEFDLRLLLVEAADNSRIAGLAQHNLGSVLGQKGAVREAMERIDRAALSREGHGIDGGQASVAESRTLLLGALYGDCIQSGQAALRRESSGASPPLEMPDLLVLLGRAAVSLGKVSEALDYFREAVTLFAAQDRRVSERQSLMVVELLESREIPDVGPDDPGGDAVYEALVALGDHDRTTATGCWTAALRTLESERPQVRILGHYARANLLLEQGDAAGAKDEAGLLVSQLAAHTADINSVELRAALVFGLVDVEGLAVRIARAGEPLDLACLVDQANTVVHSVAPLSDTDAELAERLEELRASLTATDHARVDPSEVELLEGRLRSLHRRMKRAEVSTDEPLGIAQLQAEGCTRTMVMFAESDGHLWRLVLPSSADLTAGATLTDLGPRDRLTSSIRRLRHVSDGLARRPSPIPANLIAGLDRRAGELDALLLDGVEIDNQTDVIMFPGRFLTSVPWRVLPTARTWQVAINAGTPLECHVAPIVHRSPDGPRALIVAGPDLGTGIAEEVRAVAGMYHDPIVLTGDDATVSAVISAFEEVDIAHIAGHGSLHARDPLMAMIGMADGPLTVYDIEMSSATPPTVVLASCLVGSGGSTGSEVSYGFASALASRGTKQLIISPVELDDDKTAIVMPALHRELARHGTAREALESLEFEQLDLQRVVDSLLAVETHWG